MSHNIDMSNGRANIAFLGSRNDIWHRLGNEMVPAVMPGGRMQYDNRPSETYRRTAALRKSPY